MSTGTPNLDLEYLDASQSQPEIKVNDAWNKIDAAVGSGGGINVKELGDSPSGDALNVRTIKFTGGGVTVTPESDATALVTIPTSAMHLTTKGDLLGYDTGPDRIPIGTNGYVLTADSTQALGLKWAAGGGGGGGASATWIINTQSGGSYTLQVADEDETYVRMTSASANVLNVPTNAAQAIAVGSLIRGIQGGAGTTTITPAGGVTVNTPTDYSGAARAQGSFFCLMKIATNIWDLWGDLNYTGGGGGGGMPGPFDVTIPTDSFSGFDITVGGP